MKFSNPIYVSSTSFSNNEILCEELSSLFSDVTYNKEHMLTREEFAEKLKGKEGLIFGLDEISESFLLSHPELAIVSKFGVGLDNVDLPACQRQNVTVGWTPGTNKKDVAEHTLALILGIARNIFEKNLELKSGSWKKCGGKSLSEMTVGIVGLGNIGKELAKILRYFEARVLVHDLVYDEAFCQTYDLQPCSKEEILTKADILTLHIPLTDLTYHYISKNDLSLMKRSAWLINTSRGKNINTHELKWALEHKIIAGAALDVFEEEPCEDIDLLVHPNLVVTPHTAGNSKRAVLAMGRSSIEHLKKYFESQK